MKFFIKKIYIILFLLSTLLTEAKVLATENYSKYTKENISNYFSGMLSINQSNDKETLKYLKKIKPLKEKHMRFNVEYLRTLILLDKFKDAFIFSRSLSNNNQTFFESDLLLGLDYFLKGDYKNAEIFFEQLNKFSGNNIFFGDFIGNVLIAWSKALQDNKEDSFKFIEKIPKPYQHLKKIQNIFLQCYFSDPQTQKSFETLISNKNYNFSRYNFFLVNYLLSDNKTNQAKAVIKKGRSEYSSNILLKQAEVFLQKNENKKIIDFFNCKNPKDSLAEFFYIIANIYSSEKDHRLSNFYMKISLFLNGKFKSNKALLAENYRIQKKNELSRNIYKSFKSIGSIYSWYVAIEISKILSDIKGAEYAVNNLEKEFNLLKNKNFEHHYELANFYKNHEYYKESIEHYSIVLDQIGKDHFLVPKILYRRGTSFEKIDDWKNAEKDLIASLEILPDQPHVLNYLAYTWIDKGVNLDNGLEMLKKAANLKEDDGYIIDSLGWAYYSKKNYDKAEIFLRRAVELLPLDPIVNEHYADNLWMLNKNIQARYFWSYILKLKNIDEELKNSVNKKLIFGIDKKL